MSWVASYRHGGKLAVVMAAWMFAGILAGCSSGGEVSASDGPDQPSADASAPLSPDPGTGEGVLDSEYLEAFVDPYVNGWFRDSGMSEQFVSAATAECFARSVLEGVGEDSLKSFGADQDVIERVVYELLDQYGDEEINGLLARDLVYCAENVELGRMMALARNDLENHQAYGCALDQLPVAKAEEVFENYFSHSLAAFSPTGLSLLEKCLLVYEPGITGSGYDGREILESEYIVDFKKP